MAVLELEIHIWACCNQNEVLSSLGTFGRQTGTLRSQGLSGRHSCNVCFHRVRDGGRIWYGLFSSLFPWPACGCAHSRHVMATAREEKASPGYRAQLTPHPLQALLTMGSSEPSRTSHCCLPKSSSPPPYQHHLRSSQHPGALSSLLRAVCTTCLATLETIDLATSSPD